MSCRYLKKVLQKQQQLEEEEEEEEIDEEESATDSTNPFDLLLNDQQENEPDIPDDEALNDEQEQEQSAEKNSSDAKHKSSKKKKKKKKKVDPFPPRSVSDKAEKPLDLHLEENVYIDDVKHQSGSAKGTGGSNTNVKVGGRSTILVVDPKFLSAENELRRIFGSKVVTSFESSHQTGSSRNLRGGRRGGHNPRKTILVSPDDRYPLWDGSLSMELLETRDGNHFFRYVHSSAYSRAQEAFEAAKSIHDLQLIADIAHHNPYHLESLITLAEYYRFSGEHQLSADIVERCLYALECAWHPWFSLLSQSQLKYTHETNRIFFSVLFMHMKNMDRRGCHRSALEVCKLLLSLDSDDPMGVLFCIDYYSLRAQEYQWLQQFSEEYKTDYSLWVFPNFSYSLSICRFYLDKDQDATDGDGKSAKAPDLMMQALMLHPSVLKKLVTKVPLKDRAWTNILKNSFFGSDQTGSPSLDHLINIYVERSYIIWRLPDLQKLLRDAALSVIENLERNRSTAKDWACVRKEAFSSGKNEYSHLLISDFSDSVSTMPPDDLQNVIGEARMRQAQAQNAQAGNGNGGDLRNRNAIAVLLESMLPWVNHVHGGDRREDEDADHNEHP